VAVVPAPSASRWPALAWAPAVARGAHPGADPGADPGRRAWAEIDLDAVSDSVDVICRRAGDAAVMAVVKADGYGHGAVPCAHAALRAGASWLGVAFVEEAAELRASGISAPVLVLVEPATGALEEAAALDCDVAVGSMRSLGEAEAVGRTRGQPTRVHLKTDTGLSRGGAVDDDWPQLCAAAAAAVADRTVDVVGVWSHLACADRPDHPSVAAQLSSYRVALDIAHRAGLRPTVRHLGSSGAALAIPAAHFDLVRAGISVYGLSPGPAVGTSASLGLRPAMSLRARIAMTKRVPAGTAIGYGHRYSTAAETTLALVPLGYADGVPRAASGVGEVLVAGRRRTIVGTVSMDQVVVEVGDDEVAAGDEAVVFGSGERGEPTADEWGRAIGTIGYEVVTRIGARVPRVYTATRR